MRNIVKRIDLSRKKLSSRLGQDIFKNHLFSSLSNTKEINAVPEAD